MPEHHEDFREWAQFYYNITPFDSCEGLGNKKAPVCRIQERNYLAKGKYITTSHTDTEQKCMIKCMRHDRCMAFNYHAVKKTCILMRKMLCMSPSPLNNTRYLFVHLYPCKGQPVWSSVRPEERSWSWVTTDDPRNNADIMKLPGVNNLYVSRTLYHGYYLPGFWRRDGEGFRSVDPVTMQVMPSENFWLSPILLFSGSRILLETQYRIAPCLWLDSQMECRCILWSIDIFGQVEILKRGFLDSIITSQKLYISLHRLT